MAQAPWAVGAGDSFVIITKVRDVAPSHKPQPVRASCRTKQRMLRDEHETAAQELYDPCSNGRDPWSQAKPLGPAPCASSTASNAVTSKLDQSRLSCVRMCRPLSSSTCKSTAPLVPQPPIFASLRQVCRWSVSKTPSLSHGFRPLEAMRLPRPRSCKSLPKR